jgi:hypothetical protein
MNKKQYIYITLIVAIIVVFAFCLQTGGFKSDGHDLNVDHSPDRPTHSSSRGENTKVSQHRNESGSKENSVNSANFIFQKNPASLGDFFANPEYKGVIQDDMLALMDLHNYENEKLLEAILSLKSPSERLSVCQDFFKKIAGDNSFEAFTLCMRIPQGSLRNEAFLGIGQSITGTELANFLDQLYNDKNAMDFNKLAETIPNNLQRYSTQDLEALSRINLPIELQRTICTIYGENLVGKVGAEVAYQNVMTMISDHGQNPLIGVLRAGASLDNGQEWFLHKINSNEVSINEEVERLVISIALPAIQINPIEKLDWINRIENKNLRDYTLREYVNCWIQWSPENVSTWVNSQPDSEYKDVFIYNIVKHYRAFKQDEIAKQWKERIKDTNLKSSLDVVSPK